MTRRKHQRMYAVFGEDIGIIAGTMAYSRRAAVNHLCGGCPAQGEWEQFKRDGYRTVECCVEVLTRGHRSRGPRRKTGR